MYGISNHLWPSTDLFRLLIDDRVRFAQIDLIRPFPRDKIVVQFAYRRAISEVQQVTISERYDSTNQELVSSLQMNLATQSPFPSAPIETQISENTRINSERWAATKSVS